MRRKKKGDNSMKAKKSNLPDFNTMTREEEAKWFDTHDMGDYWDELKDVDLVVELTKPKDETLVLRVNKNEKRKLQDLARVKGITVSAAARLLLHEKLRTI